MGRERVLDHPNMKGIPSNRKDTQSMRVERAAPWARSRCSDNTGQNIGQWRGLLSRSTFVKKQEGYSEGIAKDMMT